MQLIKPSFEIYDQLPGIEGIYKQIEWAGRTCYKSEDKITEDSAKPFVDRMIKSQHYAMLEHGTVYLKIPSREAYIGFGNNWVQENYSTNPYSIVNFDNDDDYLITTNYRVLVENGWLNDLKYLCEPTEHHTRRITVRFVADIGVIREFFRHRVFSMSQESTRYCNYSKNKFNNELTFILPPWIGNEREGMSLEKRDICGNTYAEICFKEGLVKIEKLYHTLLKEGWKPQEARAILPLCTKGEAVMTGFVSDWLNFFDLRALGTTGAPHPQAKELAEPLMEEFKYRQYIK